MSMTIKVPVADVEKSNVADKIEETLKTDKSNAYTIQGLMTVCFGVKASEIENKPFSAWKKGLPSLYTKIRTTLEKFEGDGKAKRKKHGKAYVFWWVK